MTEEEYQRMFDEAYEEYSRIAEKMRPFTSEPGSELTCDHCQATIATGWSCNELTLCQACWEDYGK